MSICSQNEYQRFVDNFPNLCTLGLATSEHCRLFKLDFKSSRSELTAAYQDFLDCCDWLKKCRMDDYATHYSPTSEQIQRRIENSLTRGVSHGVLVAAVLYLDLPHVKHGNLPGLSIGISRFCSHYLRSKANPVQLKFASFGH